jgi:hypothetical protein
MYEEELLIVGIVVVVVLVFVRSTRKTIAFAEKTRSRNSSLTSLLEKTWLLVREILIERSLYDKSVKE